MDKENNKEPESEARVEADVKEIQKEKEEISSKEEEKPKKKIIIVWQCLNPECTNSNKRSLR